MNACTAMRFLASLSAGGYVRQDPETQKYTLTAKLCSLGQAVRESLNLEALALPYLRSLSAHFDESSCLAVEEEMEVAYVQTVRNPSSVLRTTKRIGNLAPMHCTGVGKLLLLNKDPSAIDGLIAVKKLTAFTPKTITTRERLMEELSRIRQRGYAVDDEECEPGVKCVAVPIYDCTNRIAAALSLTGPVQRMNAWQETDVQYLKERAAALSAELGATVT
jgi:DNA-binding IclR family transcriptional regulator